MPLFFLSACFSKHILVSLFPCRLLPLGLAATGQHTDWSPGCEICKHQTTLDGCYILYLRANYVCWLHNGQITLILTPACKSPALSTGGFIQSRIRIVPHSSFHYKVYYTCPSDISLCVVFVCVPEWVCVWVCACVCVWGSLAWVSASVNQNR